MSSEPIKIGLLGLGNVGQGVVNVLRTNADEISRRVGRPLQVTHASARDLNRKRAVSTDGIELVADPMHIARDADVDIVIEAIGGMEHARALLLAALERGKPVVTANKALVAVHGNEIFAAGAKSGVPVSFEAAVAGGIPIIKALREGLSGNRISGLAGIINGTCNYILTQMSVKGQSFADALADAQKLGYAEADPTFDIQGVDAAHKLTIMASIAFGIPLSFDAVHCEGVPSVSTQDMQIAQSLGYRIKLLGIAQHLESGVSLRVHPTLVPDDQLIARVDGVLNAVVVQGNAVGPVGFYGAGAGGDATASAMVADLIDVARGLGAPSQHQVPALGFGVQGVKPLPLLPISEIESSYYLRVQVADQPGVLKAMTSVLAESDISIEAILQKEPREHEDATVALITNVVQEAKFDSALKSLTALPFVRADATRIRVEHFKA